jgi:fumarylacetoacetase
LLGLFLAKIEFLPQKFSTMTIHPSRKSWLEVSPDSDFPLQNIPFGVFETSEGVITCGSRIGDFVIDLSALHQLGYFQNIDLPDDVFLQDSLNLFISLGKSIHRAVRSTLADLFDATNPQLQSNTAHVAAVVMPLAEVTPLLPIHIGDYTDFYSSKEHATNVGMMFRDPENALLPNWLHIPVGYHGRSSSIVVSGTDIHRPKGQTLPAGAENPIFGPSKLLDFELEMGFITCDGKPLGESITTQEAEDYIFGMVLFNDWSARDIQKWEYVPLGPFLAKNFASTMSAWIVTLDALEPFRTHGPKPIKPLLPYLEGTQNSTFDIKLEVAIQPENAAPTTICQSNFKYLYWSMAQQLAHHTVNGCNINAGDLLASGTISGPTEDSFGSMLELSWSGKKPMTLENGETRTFILDNDTIIMKGFCKKDGLRIGFGEVAGKVLPAL